MQLPYQVSVDEYNEYGELNAMDYSGAIAMGAIKQYCDEEDISIEDAHFGGYENWVEDGEMMYFARMGEGKFEQAQDMLLNGQGEDAQTIFQVFETTTHIQESEKTEIDSTDDIREIIADSDGQKSVIERLKMAKGLTLDHSREEAIMRAGSDLDKGCCDCIHQAFAEQIWPAGISKSPSWRSSDDVTEQTKEWVDAVYSMEDPTYDAYANIPSLQSIEVKAIVSDEMQSDDGWSLDSIISELDSQFGDRMDRNQIETIARTETAAVLNRAQYTAIRARPDGMESIVKWEGPNDAQTTPLCEALSNEVGDGVPLQEFKSMAETFVRDYPAGKADRLDQYILHFNERHALKLVE